MNESKKGQVAGIQSGFLALMFVAVALVVVIIVAAFGADFVTNQKEALCGKEAYATYYNGECYVCNSAYASFNTTALNCYKTTNSSNYGAAIIGTTATNVTQVGLESMNNLSDGTGDVTDVGVITIVLSLLVSLIGIFGYMGYKKLE